MNQFQQIRSRLGISQAKLAQSLGVNQSAVAQYESGGTLPTPPIAWKLIKLAGVHGLPISFDDVYRPSVQDTPTTKETT